MLSICIPVYNFDIRALVADLHDQATSSRAPFEIHLLDDGSHPTYRKLNRECTILDGVLYEELAENVGRSKIRNMLAERAKYNHIIFLDCDTLLGDKFFIVRYLEKARSGARVVCGGLVYDPIPPKDSTFLHWLYGSHREVRDAAVRARNPHHSFLTGNFMVARDIFRQIRFSETLTTYGHEDTLFGCELEKQQVWIAHIDNPVVHLGLENSDTFLRKTREALLNLHIINPLMKEKGFSVKGIKILKTCRRIYRLGMHVPIAWLFAISRNRMEKNLTGPKPSLWVLDLYKLGFLCRQKLKFGKTRSIKYPTMSPGSAG